MLINLSNHPSEVWKEKQKKAAEEEYGKMLDLPFPNISAESSLEEVKALAEDYLKKVKKIFSEETEEDNAVHLMGEFTFTFNLCLLLKQEGIKTIASAIERKVEYSEADGKTSYFEFVKFREYY